MNPWRPPAGWHDFSPPCGAGDDHQEPFPASSQTTFPVPTATAAIGSYGFLASQPLQPNISSTRRPPIETFLYPPHHQSSAAEQHPWEPPLHHHGAVRFTPPSSPWPPTFAPPRPSYPSWAAVPVRPTATVPGETPHHVYSGGTAAAGEADGHAPAAGCLRMAISVGSKAAGEGRNFIVSPLSLHAALALVAAGSSGETQRELLDFLLGSSSSSTLPALHGAAEIKLVGRLGGLPQTSFACGVWVDRGRALRSEFAEVAGALYAAVAESVDFVSQSEQARQRVNAFVKHTTKGLIGNLLSPGTVNSSTVVVLANALYFKGTWAQPFDPSATFAAPFHLLDGTTVRAPFMTTSMFEQHIEDFSGFKALKLYYKNENNHHHHQAHALFYMLLILPNDDVGLSLSDLYDKAASTPGFIKKHTPRGQARVRRFMVPKFKFAFKFEASEEMQNLGVNRAFSGGDFSNMVTGGDGLFISGVYHKATVEVDELGTVAAAATAVCMQQCGRARPPMDFVADRPFLFAIVEERTDVVLFLGHVVNPLTDN